MVSTTNHSALGHFIDQNQNKLYNWSAREELTQYLNCQVKFDHEKAKGRITKWWRLTGNLEGFTLIIAKASENSDCVNVQKGATVEELDFIENLKLCKSNVFDISRDSKKKEDDQCEKSCYELFELKNSYDLTNFNTFGERSSITTTDTDLLLNTDSKRAVVIVDQDPFEFA